MKKDTPKRDRDSDNTPISSKTTKITTSNTIRTDRYSGGGGGGGDDSDEEFVDFIIGKYHERQKELEKKPEVEYEFVRITKEIKDIDDLIELAKIYNPAENKKYNITAIFKKSIVFSNKNIVFLNISVKTIKHQPSL